MIPKMIKFLAVPLAVMLVILISDGLASQLDAAAAGGSMDTPSVRPKRNLLQSDTSDEDSGTEDASNETNEVRTSSTYTYLFVRSWVLIE